MDELKEKKKKSGKTLILSVLGLCFVTFVFVILLFRNGTSQAATPPTIISYQGKLLVGSSLASSTLSMTFKLYDDATAGSIKYNSGAVSVTPTSGLFSVELGGTDGSAIDATIFKDNAALYLEIAIGAETLLPRKRITTSPYALNALYLDGRIATSTPTTTSYVPLADSSGNFNFNDVTSTEIYVSGTSTMLDGDARFSITSPGGSTYSSFNIGTIASNPGTISILGNAVNAPILILDTGDASLYSNVVIRGGDSPTITLNYNSAQDNGLEAGANATGGYVESKTTSTTLKFLSNLGDSYTSTAPFEFTANSALTATPGRIFATWKNEATAIMSLGVDGTLLVNNLGSTGAVEAPTVTVNTTLTIGGVDYTPFFINAAGTTGQLWQSDGDGRGTWVSTSTLGIIGDLPSGTTGQIFRYVASAWEATSSLFIADTGFVGVGTTTPQFKLSIANDGGIMAGGTYGSGTTLATSTGSQFIWYPRKSALVAGAMDNSYTYWSDGDLGNYAVSFGRNNKVSGEGSIAVGEEHQSNGSYSVALGSANQASGHYSVGIGSNNTNTANYGTVIGHTNTVTGQYSYALGQSVVNNATSSFAWGKDFTFAPGAASATNTIGFSTATILNNYVEDVAGKLAFIFNATSFASTSADRYIISLRSNDDPVFSVAANGNVHALGTLNASNATVGTPGTPGDLAERVDIAIDDTVEAGDVLIVDEASPDTYRRRRGAYDTSVSG